MKLINILKEEQAEEVQMKEYAKFIFEHFLKHGDFHYMGYKFKWLIDSNEVSFDPKYDINDNNDIDYHAYICIWNGLKIYYDDEHFEEFVGNALKLNNGDRSFLLSKLMYFEIFEKAIKEIGKEHSVTVYIDDVYTLFALLPMSIYPKEHSHEIN